MTEPDAFEAMFSAFTAGWPVAAPGVSFAIQNEPGALPDVPPGAADSSSASFALMQIQATTSQQMTSGGPGEREIARNGWVIVKLWVPAGESTEGMSDLVEAVRSILEFKELGAGPERVSVFDSTPNLTATDGRWFSQLVVSPYRFFELK